MLVTKSFRVQEELNSGVAVVKYGNFCIVFEHKICFQWIFIIS